MNTAEKWHGTTIVLLRKGGETIVAGDGQVSLGNTVLKSKAKKVRKIESRGVIAGFAGSTADALTLFERLEAIESKNYALCNALADGIRDVVGLQPFAVYESGGTPSFGAPAVVLQGAGVEQDLIELNNATDATSADLDQDGEADMKAGGGAFDGLPHLLRLSRLLHLLC